jgi:apolipoprotein N-acyltransferase
MRARMIIAALSGAASVFAFAPFGYWPVQIVALALLFYQVLRGGGVKRAALIGWAYGTGLVAAGVHWLYVSLHYYGAMAAPLAALAVLLLAFGMGAYGALAMAGAAWLRQRWTLSLPLTNLLVLPVAWGLSELVRGWLFTGFSWLSSGYAHNTSPLAGFAPLLGVYGLGWLAALCAGALLLLVHRSRKLAVGVLVVVMGAGFLFGRVSWTHAEGQPVSVRLLQGNVPQQEKFDPGFVLAALNMYRDAITAQGADLIATPETALAVLPQQLPPEYLPALTAFAQQSHSHLLLGIPTSDGPDQYANSAVGVAPAGQANALEQGYRYDKHHLVPFGEFIPLGFRWFTNLMSIPLGDMTRGATVQAAFPVKDQLILPNICYEDLFGEEIAEQLRSPVGGQKPATILLNISNLAWFGNTIAIPQHLQISQMRSLETGRPMLRSTNTGATAVIGADGEVKGMLAPNTRATLSAKVQGMAGDTPYILFGNKLFLALAALSLAAARLLSTRKAKREAPLAAPEKQV